MTAPVPAQTEPESAVVMYWMNSLTPGFVVNAAITSPPMVTPLLPLMLGKSNQSIVSPTLSAVLVWPVAMPPTKPPS